AAGAELFELVAADLELVLRLEWLVRSPRMHGFDHQWPDLARDRLERPPRPSGPVVAALASLHPDGRVRERAVSVMTEPETFIAHAREVVPFLVLRTTDWAAPVRMASRMRLVAFLDRFPDLLPTAAETALRLACRARSGFALNLVRASLAAAPDEVFSGFLASGLPQLRRLAAAMPERIAEDEVLLCARVETDWIARARFVETVARDAVWTGRLQNIEPLLTSAYPDVRAVAVMAFVRAGLDLRAADHLADPDIAVRAIARAAARRCGIDVARRYRDLAGMPAVAPGVLYGLAESAGRVPDAELRGLIEERLCDPRPRVRAAAIGALDMVGGLDRDRLLGLLRDPASRVVRAAAHRLEPDACRLDVGLLLALVADPERASSARRCIYTLVSKHSQEAQLGAVLTALAGADHALIARAVYDLQWITVISVLSQPSWMRSGASFYPERYVIDRSVVPDLPERFAAARAHLDPKTREAFEEMFEVYWR
ncbi:MAG: HEAT repeat domain-containing protein, partial [Sciscionella sp.]